VTLRDACSNCSGFARHALAGTKLSHTISERNKKGMLRVMTLVLRLPDQGCITRRKRFSVDRNYIA
jgi:hypothetical protein